MVDNKLKEFKLGDKIYGIKWVAPFIVNLIYKDMIIAINKKSTLLYAVMIIDLNKRIVYYGSNSRFDQYNLNSKTNMKAFIDGMENGSINLGRENCTGVELLLQPICFEMKERKEMVKDAK